LLRFSGTSADDGDYRTPVRHDYGRLLHSAAFRRLQGKTQLFPSNEFDFFRNRLTHSLEVAQVAKGIALKLNHTEENLVKTPIDLDLVEFAGLAHDLGHPPFGHNGEEALDELMRSYGGFEGNAQTLRILTCVEHRYYKQPPRVEDDTDATGVTGSGEDKRYGLDLTRRSLASILKYDNMIPWERSKVGVIKGYYEFQKKDVESIKDNLLKPYKLSSADLKVNRRRFKTIECQIMDIADDIAYSTYDLEDAFKAGFLNPLKIQALLIRNTNILDRIIDNVNKALKKKDLDLEVDSRRVWTVVENVFSDYMISPGTNLETPLMSAAMFQLGSDLLASNDYKRTILTAQLVGKAVDGVKFEYNHNCPPLSEVYLKEEILIQVEVLKQLTYQLVIMSPMLKVSQYRGKEIVRDIFKALNSEEGKHLLPDDTQSLYDRFGKISNEIDRKRAQIRVICDFIAGMTDSYAIDFYARLKSENARTIFRPL
jgi:dGTPase